MTRTLRLSAMIAVGGYALGLVACGAGDDAPGATYGAGSAGEVAVNGGSTSGSAGASGGGASSGGVTTGGAKGEAGAAPTGGSMGDAGGGTGGAAGMAGAASGSGGGGSPAAGSYKPRVINTTDLGADPDDEQSMVRQLVSASEFDLEGLVVATSCWKKTQTSTEMLDKIVTAYAEAYPNLSKHATFPTPEYLKSISVLGQKGYGMADVGTGKESPGSRLIVEAVDKPDPRPVWVTCWGGCNTIAQAITTVSSSRSPEELERFLGKLRVVDILGQDEAGAWMTKTYPKLFFIRATAVYGWQPSDQWVSTNVQSKGPLGKVYPNAMWAIEGDTPAFLYLYPNGLSDPEQVEHGNWGGRFSTAKKMGIRGMSAVKGESQYDPYGMYANVDGNAALTRWRAGYDNDFAARMDWSIKSNYADANHHPIAVVNGDVSRKVLEVTAAPGAEVALDAAGSSDPDSDTLTYAWSFYDEPSSYDGSVEVRGASSPAATVVVPAGASGKTLHVILTLRDDGAPALHAYRRVIVRVQ